MMTRWLSSLSAVVKISSRRSEHGPLVRRRPHCASARSGAGPMTWMEGTPEEPRDGHGGHRYRSLKDSTRAHGLLHIFKRHSLPDTVPVNTGVDPSQQRPTDAANVGQAIGLRPRKPQELLPVSGRQLFDMMHSSCIRWDGVSSSIL